MKAYYRSAVILCIICLLAACQNTPPATPQPIVEEEVVTTTPTEAPTAIVPKSDLPTVKFYGKNSVNDNLPRYWLYIKPNRQEVAIVDLTCDGRQSIVSAGTDGVLINNHCVIHTDQFTVYTVLPDGSVISIAPDSSFQINLGERNKDLILENGEVFVNVASQGEERSFSVLTGDVLLEALGTQFGLSMKAGSINAVVVDGQVGNYRCKKWGLEKCSEWYQSPTDITPYDIFSTSIGGDEWTKGEAYNPWPNGEPAMPLAAEEGRELNQVFLITPFEPGVYEDDTNLNASRETIKNRILDQLQQLSMDVDEYNRDVTALNELDDAYCSDYYASCWDLEPTTTDADENYTDADDGSSSPSGGGATCPECPHQFDQGSCFTRSGHLWCFPVAGTVDPAFSAEWDITAICASYPGESYCEWVK